MLWERGLQFLGGQTAAQCHEITNVLNTINEMVGLMGDLLWSAQHRAMDLDVERLAELTQKVSAQVQRGDQIVRAVNLFGHSADTPRAVFDLRSLLEQVAFMAQRPANLARVTLKTAFPQESISLENSPLGFQQAVFIALQIALGAADKERQVSLGYALADGGVEVHVTGADPLRDRTRVEQDERFLRHLVHALGGRVLTLMEPDDPNRITLAFPKHTGEKPGRPLTAAREDSNGS